MAFFPRTLYNTEASFTPLFRLLEDFDSYSRQGSQCSATNNSTSAASRRSPAMSHWQPKFDVRETGENYELHGELPGLSKEDITIEFTEPQTLVVRGKVERSYSAGTHPTAVPVEEAAPKPTVADGGDEAKAHSRQASVADEEEASAQESGFEVVEEPKAAAAEPKKPADKAKYWLSERSIGEFSRSFSFPSRVAQDEVSAGFENGVLSITVPKAKKHESRRIAVL